MFDPIGPIRTFIQWACNAVPRTGKHMNDNNQLEEELAHAYFRYTKNKHEKTSYELRVGFGYWVIIWQLFHPRMLEMRWLKDEAWIIVVVKSPHNLKDRKLKLMLHKPFSASRVSFPAGKVPPGKEPLLAQNTSRFSTLIVALKFDIGWHGAQDDF